MMLLSIFLKEKGEIFNTKNNSFMHTEIVKNIILALNNRKEVKCFEKLSKNELNRIKNIAVMNETIFVLLTNK